MSEMGEVPKTSPDMKGKASGDSFTFAELPPETKNIYGTSEQFYQAVSNFLTSQADGETEKAEYIENLHPHTESEAFKKEIDNPHFTTDPESGITYAAYRFNREKKDRPVVVRMSWSVGAESRSGRPFLNALSNNIDRPIIYFDPAATGRTSVPSAEYTKQMDFDMLAASEARILDRELEALGERDFDLMGMSMGGIQAEKLAERYGSRVKNLITESAPGFARVNILRFAKGFAVEENQAMADLAKKDEYGQSEERKIYEDRYGKLGVTFDLKDLPSRWKALLTFAKPALPLFTKDLAPEQLSAERIPAFVKLAQLMAQGPLVDMERRLSDETYWTDIVGSSEAISDYRDHLRAVRIREADLARYGLPRRSDIHILGKQPHAHLTVTARAADDLARALTASEKRRGRDPFLGSHGPQGENRQTEQTNSDDKE